MIFSFKNWWITALITLVSIMGARANYKMDIRIIRKGGIDSGLVLASEYYYSEWVPLGQEFTVSDRARQYVLSIKSDYIKEDVGVDVTNKVEITAKFQNGQNEIPVSLMQEPVKLMIGETREFTLKLDNEREFNISMTPRRP